MKRLRIIGAGLLMAAALPALAEAANGYATANVNLRAGPSTGYPAVTVIPAGAGVDIYGCMSGANWCDVGFAGIRGWVSGSYLQAIYGQRRVYVGPEYYRPLGIPAVTFSIGNYWDRHYRSRDFYRDRDRWDDRRDWRDDRRDERRDEWRDDGAGWRDGDRWDDRRDVRRDERRDDRRDVRRDDRDDRRDVRRDDRRDDRRDARRDDRRDDRRETRRDGREQIPENMLRKGGDAPRRPPPCDPANGGDCIRR
ncbi:SH3 domain-containing protein [Pseudomonas sp. R2.Fl]|nr:SH3 domain-containing protein [Pseudomonas sp. R2.Fl]